MRAFADALDAVPMALAENSGLSPIEALANIKSRQAKEKNTRLGVDCMQTGSNGKSKFPIVDLARFTFLLINILRGLCLHLLLFVHTAVVRVDTAAHPCNASIRGPVVHITHASTGCSAMPPRNDNTPHIQRCNHEWK